MKIKPSGMKINGFSYTHRETLQKCRAVLQDPHSEPWKQSVFKFIALWLDNSAIVTIKTSGTTGKPKNIQVNKSSMIASAYATRDFFGLEKGDRSLLCLSADYIAGKMMIVRAWTIGLDLILLPPSSHPLAALPDEMPIKIAAVVPLQVRTILSPSGQTEKNAGLRKLRQIDLLLVGGSFIADELCIALSRFCQVYVSYGMTETLSHIALKRICQPLQKQHYRTLPGVTVDRDHRGCLVISAPHLNIEKLPTNDLVDIYAPNEFELTGRFDHVINTGAVKVFPEQVEKKIGGLLKNQRFFIYPEPDDRLYQKVCLLIEGKPLDDAAMNCLKDAIAKRVAPYERPGNIRFTEHFMETQSGKIQRTKTINSLQTANNP